MSGIKFYNINSGELRDAETEPQIAAYWNSSDRGPNATLGQDFGWRLAPETLMELKRVQGDAQTLESISHNKKIAVENLSGPDILLYILEKNQGDERKTGQDQTAEDFERQYQDEIRGLEAKRQVVRNRVVKKAPQEVPQETPQNQEDLTKLNRTALEQIAVDLGVENVNDFVNKNAIIEAINDKRNKES